MIREESVQQWSQNLKESLIPGAAAGLTACAAVAAFGQRDSDSAIAPINATSHVLWGEEAARVERATLRHTLPGLAINASAGIWWALVFKALFGRAAQRSHTAAIAGGLATAALAYGVDYHLVPKRLTPGWESRISDRSLYMTLGAMGLVLGVGAILARRA